MSNETLKFEAEGIIPSASSASRPQTGNPRSRRLRFATGLLAIGALAVAFGSIVTFTPWYQEWHLSRLSLEALQRESDRPAAVYDPRLLYYLGRRLNDQGQFAAADPILRKAVGLDIESARLRDEWARALLGAGLTTAAFGQLREFAGTHPNSAEAHLILGKFYITQSSMRRAIEELEQTVRLDPNYAEGWAYLVVAEKGMGNTGPALNAARKAVALRPANVGDRLRLALLLSAPGTSDSARAAFEEAIRLGPESDGPHRAFASWLIQSGDRPDDLSRAETEARRAISLSPADAAGYMTLGRVLLRENRAEEARSPLEKASDLLPFDPAPPQALAQAAHRLGNATEERSWEQVARTRQEHANAKQSALTAVLANPEKPEPHRRMARILASEGDVEGCLKNYASALHRAPDAPPVLIEAANALSEMGHAPEAVQLARRAADISPASPAAQEAIGNALLASGQPHDAADAFDRACVFWPEKFDTYKARLAAYHRQKAAERHPVALPLTAAEKAYRRSREIIGSQVGPLLITQEAENLALRAVELEPKNAAYLRHLLNLQFQQKKYKEATNTANRLLNVAPDDARGHALLAVLLADQAAGPEEIARVRDHIARAATDPATEATRHYAMGLLALARRDGAEAVRELEMAARIDPEPEVTYYKLFLAYRLLGDQAGATRSLDESKRRHTEKRAEAEALKTLSEKTDQPAAYARAAEVFESHGHHAQAQAILSAAPSRTSSTPSRPSSPHNDVKKGSL